VNKNVRTSVKAEANDAKEGMSLGELRAAVAAVTGMPDDSRVKVRVGYSAQVRSIEIIGQEHTHG
jgi:hypothetical protein